MKKFNKIIALATVSLMTLTACKRDKDSGFSENDKNSVTLKFENILANQGSIELGSTKVTSTAGQKHQFTTMKYIVSNVVLIKEDGTEYKYEFNNPDKGAYIVDQSEQASTHNFVLKNIPAGNYESMKFGLGISPEAYVLGGEGQAIFWDLANTNGMGWNWASGYKFVNFEGTYGENLDRQFKYHVGNVGNPEASGTPNVYKVVTLDFPQKAKVRKNVAPQVHIMADIHQFLSGTNSITLSPENETSMNPNKLSTRQASENLANMFSVHHIHND